MNNKRFDEIDIMRIIGFFMVVNQHILGAYAQRPEASFKDSMVLHFFYLLGRPAVPMFVAITGFTLFYVNYNEFNIKKFYKKRLTAIVMPYLFWSFATIFIFNKYYMLKDIAAVIITGTASYHLWYMGMSIRIYIWFPFILAVGRWLMKRGKNTRRWLFILYCIFYWILLKNNISLIDQINVWLFNTPTFFTRRFIQYCPILWSMYFVCGAIVWFNYENFKETVMKNWRIIAAAYVPLTAYMYYTQICKKLPGYFPRINYEYAIYVLFMLNTILLVYIISVKVSGKAGRFKRLISDLSSLSYGAYLVHVIVLQKVAPIIQKSIPIGSYLFSGLMIFTATCALSFIVCYIIRYLPLSKYIIGVKTKTLPIVSNNCETVNKQV